MKDYDDNLATLRAVNRLASERQTIYMQLGDPSMDYEFKEALKARLPVAKANLRAAWIERREAIGFPTASPDFWPPKPVGKPRGRAGKAVGSRKKIGPDKIGAGEY